jgi:serine protease Do
MTTNINLFKKWNLFWFSAIVCAILLSPKMAITSTNNDELSHLRKTSKAFTHVAKDAIDTVVFIQVEKTIKAGQSISPFEYNNPFDLFNDDFFNRFFGHRYPHMRRPREYKQQGWGSGFIISENGYVLTNHHVVGDADRITVRLKDKREFKAKIIGTDARSDVALIKIEDAEDLPVLPLGDSDFLEVGEWVMAIGNPFGLSHTLTVGVVSAKGRTTVGITDYEDFIQTDAAINPGNSGGPLINLEGEAVGINSAIFSKSGGYMGIGFAIPINMVKSIKDQLIESGEVSRGYLGVMIQDLTEDLKESFDLGETEGVLIANVTEDSPADKGGIKRGDVVIEFNDTKVTSVGQFRNRVALTPPGKKVNLTIIRKGKKKTLSLKLGNLKEGEIAKATQSDMLNDLGLTVQNLPDDLARQYGYEAQNGVLISQVNPGSSAQFAGLRPGMLILEVNRQSVKIVKELLEALEESRRSKKVLLLVQDGRYSKYVMLNLD